MRTRLIALVLIAISALTACNTTPSHVSYIPKDAAIVLGINTNELGKKIAWDAIWGSKLLDELKKNGVDTGIFKDMSQSGIKAMSTYYVYLRPDKRFEGSNRVTAVLPIDNVSKLEAYLKKTMPGISIKQQKDRKEALLGDNIYAGWDDKVFIMMNVIYQPTQETPLGNLGEDADPETVDSLVKEMSAARKADEATMPAEMEKAFATTKDNAITDIKHFKDLEQANHDMSLWINYEVLMGQYMTSDMTGGLTLSGGLWKDAAMASGIDFEKGAIKGNLKYYASPELSEIFKEFSKDNADKELIERMPGNALALLAAWHISPKAIKMMLEKMGMTGFANAAIADKNLTVDYILDAFDSDMALALNNFVMQPRTIPADSLYPGQEEIHTSSSDIDYAFVLKKGKKENFDRLIQMAVAESMLVKQSEGHYIIGAGMRPTFVIVNDKEMAVSNRPEIAEAALSGQYKQQDKKAAMDAIKGHPFGLFFDVKAMTANIDPGTASNPADANKMTLSKNLLSDVRFTGGNYKQEAFEYNLEVNFINKDENSLLILMDYANKMAKTTEESLVATGR